jgi:hypothetical protein
MESSPFPSVQPLVRHGRGHVPVSEGSGAFVGMQSGVEQQVDKSRERDQQFDNLGGSLHMTMNHGRGMAGAPFS